MWEKHKVYAIIFHIHWTVLVSYPVRTYVKALKVLKFKNCFRYDLTHNNCLRYRVCIWLNTIDEILVCTNIS